MKARLINLWDDFRESFWCMPIIMSLFATVAAILMVAIDSAYAIQIEESLAWISSSPASSRSALSGIASAMLTLVGVVLSITLVAVSMASSQYGSRLLRCFMTDSLADYVMGTFIGTGLFSLIALRSVRDASELAAEFTPNLSTAAAVIMGLFSIGLLVYFIHDVAISIQAPRIVESLARDLNDAVERLYPDELDESETQNADPSFDNDSSIPITSCVQGYIEGIDRDTLVEAACGVSGLIRLSCRAGGFVVEADEIARVTTSNNLSEEQRDTLSCRIQSALVIGARRTPRQDVVCSVLEVVDVASRSLSPGINDPFTAMNCIDRLAGALSKMATRADSNSCFHDSDGIARLIVSPVTCEEVIHDAFQQIRQYGASSVAVSIRMVDAFSTIARHATRSADFESLAMEAIALRAAFLGHDPQSLDRRQFERRFERLSELLNQHVDFQQITNDANA